MSFVGLLADVVMKCAPLVLDGAASASHPDDSADCARRLRSVVDDAATRLASLIDSRIDEVLAEFKVSERRGAVRELKAHVEALHQFLALKASDGDLRQLIAPSIGPLQVAVNRAREVLREDGSQEFALYCEVTGIAALIAGQEFVGVDTAPLRRNLDDRLRIAARLLLDRLARRCLESGEPFPWERVGAVLELRDIDGIKARLSDTSIVPHTQPRQEVDVSAIKIAEARPIIAAETSVETLLRFIGQEVQRRGQYQARDKIIGAVVERIGELQERP